MSTKWYAGRHGATSENNPKREVMRGQSNIALDEKGRKEARALGEFLKDKGITHIYYSPATRTKETAAIIKRIVKVPATEDDDLITWNPGVLTGKPVHAVKNVVNWYETHPSATVPDGERTGEFNSRMNRAWGKYIKLGKTSKEPFLVLAHSRPLLKLEARLDEKTEPAAFHEYWNQAPAPGSVLEISGDKYRLVRGGVQKKAGAKRS